MNTNNIDEQILKTLGEILRGLYDRADYESPHLYENLSEFTKLVEKKFPSPKEKSQKEKNPEFIEKSAFW